MYLCWWFELCCSSILLGMIHIGKDWLEIPLTPCFVFLGLIVPSLSGSLPFTHGPWYNFVSWPSPTTKRSLLLNQLTASGVFAFTSIDLLYLLLRWLHRRPSALNLLGHLVLCTGCASPYSTAGSCSTLWVSACVPNTGSLCR